MAGELRAGVVCADEELATELAMISTEVGTGDSMGRAGGV